MSSKAQTHEPQDSGIQKSQIASEAQREAFVDLVERPPLICNNCFAQRELEHRHFRSSGGRATGGSSDDDRTSDRFCTECEAGTGESDLHRPHEEVDYSNVTCNLSRMFLRDMGGTVERTWSEDAPLPQNGETVSFARNLKRLSTRLEEAGYAVDWQQLKRIGSRLKCQHPSRDRAIFAKIAGTVILSADG